MSELIEVEAISASDSELTLLGVHAQEIRKRLRRSVQDIVEIGLRLQECKSILGHGAFLQWIEAECELGERMAQHFMNVADKFKSENISDLKIAPSTLYLLASDSTPEEVRDKALEEARNGARVTQQVVREWLKADVQPPAQNRFYHRGESGTDEHYTPFDVVDAVVRCFGTIHLDPCSNSHDAPNIPAVKRFTREDDGLSRDWFGNVYVNFPFSAANAWVKKICLEADNPHVDGLIVLAKSDNRTEWYAELIEKSLCYCEYRGCLRFGSPTGKQVSAPFPVTLFYFGADVEGFFRSFSRIGWVVQQLSAGMFES